MQAEDQERVQGHVGHVGRHRDGQRRPGVLQSPQHPGPGQHHEHRGCAEQADAQVGGGLGADAGRAAERVHDLRRQRPAGRQDHRADDAGQPQPVDALADGRLTVARADLPRHRCRGPVGQEDREAHQGREGLAGHAEPAERGGAEPADDHRVREQEQRLGDQRPEGGHGEPQDFRVAGVPARRPGPAAAKLSGRRTGPGEEDAGEEGAGEGMARIVIAAIIYLQNFRSSRPGACTADRGDAHRPSSRRPGRAARNKSAEMPAHPGGRVARRERCGVRGIAGCSFSRPMARGCVVPLQCGKSARIKWRCCIVMARVFTGSAAVIRHSCHGFRTWRPWPGSR